MKISRLKMHRGPKGVGTEQALRYTRQLLCTLFGEKIPQRSQDPHGPSDVIEYFSRGFKENLPGQWMEELCDTVASYPRKHFCTLPHYILYLQQGETFGSPRGARFAAEKLLQAMGYQETNQVIVIRHAATAKSHEHLHIVACRIVPTQLSLIQEANGWFQRAMAQLSPFLEYELNLYPEPGAVYRYDEMSQKIVRVKHRDSSLHRLKASSRAYEDNNGGKSPERIAKEAAILAVQTLEVGLNQGRKLTWPALHMICAKCGLLIKLERGITFVTGDGRTWFNASQISKRLGMKYYPGSIPDPYCPIKDSTLSHFIEAKQRAYGIAEIQA